MHNPALARLGLNWRYLAFATPPEELPRAIEGAKAMRFVGLNLTVPHKLLAYRLADFIDESARPYEAVNTLRFEVETAPGRFEPIGAAPEIPEGPVRARGFNTDAEAIVRALREDLGVEPRGARALILGAGGAGRTAALRLAAEPVAALWLVNRTRAKAEALAERIRRLFPETPVRLGYPDEEVDFAVNATSLGLRPGDPIPWDVSRYPLTKAGGVYDMIYQPAETPLLRAARAAGCRTANGLGMLLYQGARALEIWSGRPAPVEAMRRALERQIYGD